VAELTAVWSADLPTVGCCLPWCVYLRGLSYLPITRDAIP
jgi:hypothetical protein